jgi:phosphoserine phosphatase RsbU/P
MNDAQLFVSMMLAIVDVAKQRLHWCSVGHCEPLLIATDGRAEFLAGSRNPIAGLVPGLDYAVAETDFPAGSRVLIYTDGVTEAEDAAGAQFGEEGLLRVVAQGSRDIDDIAMRLLEAVDAFADGHPQSDDITLLIAGVA